MGPKITIDSATLMNKGLEVIEARWLFDAPPEKVDVVVHPQSIVHSLVEFKDGSVLAQLGLPDMRVPIAVALAHPERLPLDLPRLDLAALARLEFEDPDRKRFPCLDLAYQALRSAEAAPAVLNAANEISVAAFLEGRIAFPVDRRRERRRARGLCGARRLADARVARRRDRSRRLGARARARMARTAGGSQRMTALTYVFAFVLMLSVLIFVHELGHFLVARWCGVRVLKFCLGFGPPIGIGRWRLAWKRRRNRVRDRVVPARRLRQDARARTRTRSTIPRCAPTRARRSVRSRSGRSSPSCLPAPP